MKHILKLIPLLLAPLAAISATNDTVAPPPAWDQVRRVTMSGGLRVFWNVHGGHNLQLELRGKHTALFHVTGSNVKRI